MWRTLLIKSSHSSQVQASSTHFYDNSDLSASLTFAAMILAMTF